MPGCMHEAITSQAVDDHVLDVAEMGDGIDDGFKDWLDVTWRRRDDAQDFGRGGLLLAGLSHLGGEHSLSFA
jgi:hypothetical protein